MDIWEELFGRIGLWVIPLMILAWIAREIFQYNIKKKLFKFSTTFTNTVGAVKQILDELPKLEKVLNDLYYTPMPVGFNPPQVDAYDASNKVKEFCAMASGVQIFFPQEISDNLDTICKTLEKISNNLGLRQEAMRGGGIGPMEEDCERDALDLLSSTLPELSSQLESTLKVLLDVEAL